MQVYGEPKPIPGREFDLGYRLEGQTSINFAFRMPIEIQFGKAALVLCRTDLGECQEDEAPDSLPQFFLRGTVHEPYREPRLVPYKTDYCVGRDHNMEGYKSNELRGVEYKHFGLNISSPEDVLISNFSLDEIMLYNESRPDAIKLEPTAG